MTIHDENDNIMTSQKQAHNPHLVAGNNIWNNHADMTTPELNDSGNDGDFDSKSLIEDKDDKSSAQTTLAQKRRFADVKPPYSYIALITMALESSTSGV